MGQKLSNEYTLKLYKSQASGKEAALIKRNTKKSNLPSFSASVLAVVRVVAWDPSNIKYNLCDNEIYHKRKLYKLKLAYIKMKLSK